VEHLGRLANHLGPNLNVFNQLTRAMVAIARLVLADKRKDPSRGNQFKDVGFASDRNSTRGAEFGGVGPSASRWVETADFQEGYESHDQVE
jgi:hypothetical protein